MTSTVPPNSRPLSSAAPSLDPHVGPVESSSQHHQGPDKASSMVDDDDDVQFIDSRPVKRRKTSHSLASAPVDSPTAANDVFFDANQSTNAHYLGVPWLSLLETESKQAEQDANTTISATAQPPPLPARPWSARRPHPTSLEHGRPGSRVRLNFAVPTTPDCMPGPVNAPILEDQNKADYFPWAGNHPEDILNEGHVKQGFIDRPLPNPPEKELNSGKANLHSGFKHRPGIEGLSALFSLLLDQKDKRNTLSNSSNFKGPPPRVTLTEAKRKSWIADLADPKTPLRRLSKTIPQGIRGQMLLDQCVSNSVPLSRAVWFAKCVGANEIRTLKRKGVTSAVTQGAEAKWLKEWTVSIEQFVEHNLAQCGQEGWRQQIQYVVQLVSRLYAGSLLDRDHFLDWIVKSVIAAKTNVLPFWLMVSGMFRWDLLQFRKRARQFAEALVMKYQTVSTRSAEVLLPLVQKLKDAVCSCFSLRPMSFLMPERWVEYGGTLMACVNAGSEATADTFNKVKHANESILYGEDRRGLLDSSLTERALKILDTVQLPFDFEKLSESLLGISQDHHGLVAAVAGWAVTKFRTGNMRIYLAARLLRRWLRQDASLDNTLIGTIFKDLCSKQINLSALQHLVSELSRSHVFSISKILNYLSVRGLPKRDSYLDSETQCLFEQEDDGIRVQCPSEPSQLLTELCINNVDPPLRSWRSTMLSRAGYDSDNETDVVAACLSWIERFVSDDSAIQGGTPGFLKFSCLSWSIRTQLSRSIRDRALKLIQAQQELALDTFCRMRFVLESLNDLAILADILRIVAHSKNEVLLSTSVDTISFHAEALSAIGALDTLQQLYCRTYLMLRPVKLSMPFLTSSLIELCLLVPSRITPVSALKQEFVRGDRGRAIAACSPFSDGIAESLEQAGETFHDDFEAILQTESNMNEQTMIQLFDVLTNRIVKLYNAPDHNQADSTLLLQLLCRLKICREAHGTLLIRQWLSRLNLAVVKRDTLLILNLVGSRCVDLEIVLDLFRSGVYTTALKENLFALLDTILDFPEHRGFAHEVCYSVKLATKHVILKDAALALDVFNPRLDVSATMLALRDQVVVNRILQGDDDISNSTGLTSELTNHKVDEVLGSRNVGEESAHQALILDQLMDPFALPFCQIHLHNVCQDSALRNDQEFQLNLADALCKWLEEDNPATQQTATTIQALLKCVGVSIEAKVKSKLEQSFFMHLPKTFSTKLVTQPAFPTSDEMKSATASFQRVALVSSGKSDAPHSGNGGLLIEKLNIYLKCLGAASAAVGNANAASSPVATMHVPLAGLGATAAPPEWTPKFIFTTLDLLHLLLQMVCLKRAALGPSIAQPLPAAAKQQQQDQIKVVGLLISIATHPSWQSAAQWAESTPSQRQELATTTDMIFDVAAVLVDDMVEESRGFCARLLKDKLRDDRVKWLLGNVNTNGSAQCRDAGHGLEMFHEGKGVVTGEFKPKVWEMLEYNGTTGDTSLALGLFGAKRV